MTTHMTNILNAIAIAFTVIATIECILLVIYTRSGRKNNNHPKEGGDQ